MADIAADRGKAVADRLGSAGHFVGLDVTSETTEGRHPGDGRQVRRAARAAEFRGIGLSRLSRISPSRNGARVHAIDLDGVFLGCKHGVADDQEAHE